MKNDINTKYLLTESVFVVNHKRHLLIKKIGDLLSRLSYFHFRRFKRCCNKNHNV